MDNPKVTPEEMREEALRRTEPRGFGAASAAGLHASAAALQVDVLQPPVLRATHWATQANSAD